MIKVGDLVTHNGRGNPRYCIVCSIEDNKVWGNWQDSIEEARKVAVYRSTQTHINNILLVSKEHSKEEKEMKKCISKNFKNTDDALLVEKWSKELVSDIDGESFVSLCVIKTHKEAILKEAKRLEEESNK